MAVFTPINVLHTRSPWDHRSTLVPIPSANTTAKTPDHTVWLHDALPQQRQQRHHHHQQQQQQQQDPHHRQAHQQRPEAQQQPTDVHDDPNAARDPHISSQMAYLPPTPPLPRHRGPPSYTQLPLPSSPFPASIKIPDSIEEDASSGPESSPGSRTRHSSQKAPQVKKRRRDSEDTDMGGVEGDERADNNSEGHESDMSDDEHHSADGDGNPKSGKKKKSQRFFCTDFPPCNLSFTRSEHLARHIRKHTGERPFTCHCQRKFSRLDNLRQHAQTVHVNEEIPNTSLAASGTRYQRQVRTDSMRHPSRARSSTAGSLGVPARGHGKSLSTSNIGTIPSNLDSYAPHGRPQPTPVIMTHEPYPANERPGYSARGPSPGEFSTPSSTFSTTQSSPRWGPLAAPAASHSRSRSMYAGTTAQPSERRLSVPSSGIPFEAAQYPGARRPQFEHGSGPPGPAANEYPAYGTLASSAPSGHLRAVSSSNEDEAWRRRTWHPESNHAGVHPSPPAQYHLSPAAPRPDFSTQPREPSSDQHGGQVRLPGIASFLQDLPPLPHRPASPARPQPLMAPDNARPATAHQHTMSSSAATDTRGNWNMGLHRGLTKLDSANRATPPKDGAGAWAQDAYRAVDAAQEAYRAVDPDVERVRQQMVRFEHAPVIVQHERPRSRSPRKVGHQHTLSAPIISRDPRRSAWRNGVAVHREASPERVARAERMIHPNIDQFPGFPAREAPPAPVPQLGPGRLETLVNAATHGR